MPPGHVAIDDETAASMPHGIAEAAGPGGLEAGEHADGFQERGFALGVRAEEDVFPRRELALEGVEAPEVAQGEAGEHGDL